MKGFHPVYVLKRWFAPVLIFILACTIIFDCALLTKQKYRAEAVLSYTSDEAQNKGTNPDDTALDPEEIRSAAVVKAALKKVNVPWTVDEVRSALCITEIVPENIEKVQDGAALEGEEYVYVPTDYRISCTLNTDDAYPVLQAVIDSYFDYYTEKHIDLPAMVKTDAFTNGANTDYLYRIQSLDRNVNAMTEYLESFHAPDSFRSGITGYTFAELLKEYASVHELDIVGAYGFVLKNALAQNQEQIISDYQKKIEDNEFTIERDKALNDKLLSVLGDYTNKAKQSEVVSYELSKLNKAEKGSRDTNATTYEQLFSEYMENAAEIADLTAENIYNRNILSAYENSVMLETAKQEADKDYEEIAKQLTVLDEAVRQTVSEYADVVCSESLQQKNTVSMSEKYNIPFFVFLFILLLAVICTALVLLGAFLKQRKGHKKHGSLHEEKVVSDFGSGFLPIPFSFMIVKVKKTEDDELLNETLSVLKKLLNKKSRAVRHDGTDLLYCFLDNTDEKGAEQIKQKLLDEMDEEDGSFRFGITTNTWSELYTLDRIIEKTEAALEPVPQPQA